MGKLLSSHRSTTYPCFVPVLGDSAGAGRERLTRRKFNNNFLFTIYFAKFVSLTRTKAGASCRTTELKRYFTAL